VRVAADECSCVKSGLRCLDGACACVDIQIAQSDDEEDDDDDDDDEAATSNSNSDDGDEKAAKATTTPCSNAHGVYIVDLEAITGYVRRKITSLNERGVLFDDDDDVNEDGVDAEVAAATRRSAEADDADLLESPRKRARIHPRDR
jgi:hypothetical protein